MKKVCLILTIIGFIMVSCSNSKKGVNIIANENVSSNRIESESLTLFKQNCYACHSVVSKSHDEIIAPPMVAVKRRYLMSYPNKKEFIEAFTNWALNPIEENALMRGAVANFKIMPKQSFNRIDVEKIATYIFENEIEKPVWFENHFNNEHPNGMGNGNGKGRGRGKF